MIPNHILNVYNPHKNQLQNTKNNKKNLYYYILHIVMVSLIPAFSAYYASVYIGWSINTDEPIKLTPYYAAMMSVSLYITLITGVFILACVIYGLAKRFGSHANFIQSITLAAYTLTPVLISGLASLYPVLWFIALIGVFSLSYSIYLLYIGIPILMKVSQDKGFIYASSVVTGGLILFILLMTVVILLWNLGITSSIFINVS